MCIGRYEWRGIDYVNARETDRQTDRQREGVSENLCEREREIDAVNEVNE